jgi:DNA mismatch repair protein MutL
VRDRLLGRALSEGYRAMMPAGAYPSAMLFVALPPGDVDVNVHPAKTEVRFLRSALVIDLVRDAVRGAIGSARAAATPYLERPAEPLRPLPADAIDQTPAREPAAAPSEAPEAPFQLSPLDAPAPRPEQSKIALSFAPPAPPAMTQPEMSESSVPATPHRTGCLGGRGGAEVAGSPLKPAQNLTLTAEEINPLGQLHASFIIAADRAGLLLIDQHVAHERILFEQHWRALRAHRIEVQRLLLPETIDLAPAQAASFDQAAPELEENGFEVGRLSGRTIAIKAIPAVLPPGAAQSLLVELLDALEAERRGLTLDQIRSEIAASLACRAAIKINTPLAREKMRWMIDELLKVDNPATCPHGRPIILRLTAREIERGFQRS